MSYIDESLDKISREQIEYLRLRHRITNSMLPSRKRFQWARGQL